MWRFPNLSQHHPHAHLFLPQGKYTVFWFRLESSGFLYLNLSFLTSKTRVFLIEQRKDNTSFQAPGLDTTAQDLSFSQSMLGVNWLVPSISVVSLEYTRSEGNDHVFVMPVPWGLTVHQKHLLVMGDPILCLVSSFLRCLQSLYDFIQSWGFNTTHAYDFQIFTSSPNLQLIWEYI